MRAAAQSAVHLNSSSVDNRHSEADGDGQTGTRAHLECTPVQAPGGR